MNTFSLLFKLSKLSLFILFSFTVFSLVPSSWAGVHKLPPSTLNDALSESKAEAFDPNGLTTEDFEIQWITTAEHAAAQIRSNTLEWVRVADFIVVPRARLRIEVLNSKNGRIQNKFHSSPLTMNSNGRLVADFPVVLNSHSTNTTELLFERNGTIHKASFKIRFKPRKEFGEKRVFFDPSCSSYSLNAVRDQIAEASQTHDSWMYVGCRLVTQRSQGLYLSGFIEVFIYWDGASEELLLGGIPLKEEQPSLWILRLSSKSSQTLLESNGHQVELGYFVPDPFHRLSFGLGVGPYFYTYNDINEQVYSIAPVVTIYGSYFFTDSLRLVTFDATSVHRKFYSDLGVYLLSESIRALDNRISINLLIGGHVIVFQSENSLLARTGVPQGFELVFRDFLAKKYNLGMGAFLFPPINDQVYYNLWLRWGSSGFFAEVNYLAWQEKAVDYRTYTRSLGISFGFPIGRFF